MAFDLAKELGSLVDKMQTIVSQSLAASGGKVSGPTLKLNAVAYQLRSLRDSLASGEAAGAPGPAKSGEAPGAPGPAQEPNARQEDDRWGSAFEERAPARPEKPQADAEFSEGSVAKDWIESDESSGAAAIPPPAEPWPRAETNKPKRTGNSEKKPKRDTLKKPAPKKPEDDDRDLWEDLS